ncbi:zona pellucida sperm-binding protein 3 [Denticeps clupeoides]|uniref:zona pellucida sperm-binding protein 3 n=1 Tax=Denticeps clupeoides TaxID=299321 RepID=UPI0010A4F09C|nr:zona pellucida sperm-binding protein 3-like [Denticeps clupeoides]
MLLPTPVPPPGAAFAAAPGPVEALCHLDRMYVRIQKVLFSNANAWKYLSIGTCPVNQNTAEHYYFLYYLSSCDIRRQDFDDYVTFSNTLYYKPEPIGQILRELPFSVPVTCKYNRFFRTYTIGFFPIIKGGTVVKKFNAIPDSRIILCDDSWSPLVGNQSYVVGKPMNFEVRRAVGSAGNWAYVNKCFITASQDPNSSPSYTVIDNNGCMIDGKNSPDSKFISRTASSLRFSVSAFVFSNSTSSPASPRTLFLNCQLSQGPPTPSASAKSCTYDLKTKSWKELLGDYSVCACCESSCTTQPTASLKMLTSQAFDLAFDPVMNEPTMQKKAPPHRSFKVSKEADFWDAD